MSTLQQEVIDMIEVKFNAKYWTIEEIEQYGYKILRIESEWIEALA